MHKHPLKSIMLTREEAERIADGLQSLIDNDYNASPNRQIADSALIGYICKEFRIDLCGHCESHQDITEMRRDKDGLAWCASCYAKHIQKEDRP